MGTSKRWISIAILTLMTILLLSSCTRERLTDSSILQVETPAQEPLIVPVNTQAPSATDTPVPPPTETPEPRVIVYEVREGDMVSSIAEKFGTDVQTLRTMNLLATDNLQVGQMLRVPNIPGVTTPEGLPTPTPEPFHYIVQERDTLLSIADNFNISPDTIVDTNLLPDPNNLTVGQILLIPGPQEQSADGTGADTTTAEGGASSQARAYAPGTHTIRAGESLSVIAQQYEISLADLIAANGITQPDLVSSGTVLIIPGLTAIDIKIRNQQVYTIQAGDTLSAIAQKFGVDVTVIINANDIQDPNLLQAGVQLIIPDP